MIHAKRTVESFMDGIFHHDPVKVRSNTQLTWLTAHDVDCILKEVKDLSKYAIESVSLYMAGVAEARILINDHILCNVRLLREIAPYKPDPDSENGVWGVNPCGLIKGIHEQA